MNSDLASDDDLRRSVDRAAVRDGSMTAGLVRIWERAFPVESLSAHLGCTTRKVIELSLCLRPRVDSWIADVTEIARAVDIDPTKLEAFYRSAEVLERLALAHPVDQHVGQLMAARDREDED